MVWVQWWFFPFVVSADPLGAAFLCNGSVSLQLAVITFEWGWSSSKGGYQLIYMTLQTGVKELENDTTSLLPWGLAALLSRYRSQQKAIKKVVKRQSSAIRTFSMKYCFNQSLQEAAELWSQQLKQIQPKKKCLKTECVFSLFSFPSCQIQLRGQTSPSSTLKLLL